MKTSVLIICIFYLLPLTVLGQIRNFTEHAFLNIYSNNKVFVYKDSLSDERISEINNNDKEDKYYFFEIQNKYKSRVHVIGKYTKDAGHLDLSFITGWMDISKLFIFYNKKRASFQTVYSKASRHSEKKIINSIFFKLPIQIVNVDFVENEIWFNVLIRISKTQIITGWLPPEFQCNDIWNACEGN